VFRVLNAIRDPQTYDVFRVAREIRGNLGQVKAIGNEYPSLSFQTSTVNMYFNLLLLALKPVYLFAHAVILYNLSSSSTLRQITGCDNPQWEITETPVGRGASSGFDCDIKGPMSLIFWYGLSVIIPYILLYLYKALYVDTDVDSFRPIPAGLDEAQRRAHIIKNATKNFAIGFLTSFFLDSFWYPVLLPTRTQLNNQARYEFGNFKYFEVSGILNFVALILIAIHSISFILWKCCCCCDRGNREEIPRTAVERFLVAYLACLCAVGGRCGELGDEAERDARERARREGREDTGSFLAFIYNVFALIFLAITLSVFFSVAWLIFQPVFNFFVFLFDSPTLVPEVFSAFSVRVRSGDTFVGLGVITYLDIFSFLLGVVTFVAQMTCPSIARPAPEVVYAPGEPAPRPTFEMASTMPAVTHGEGHGDDDAHADDGGGVGAQGQPAVVGFTAAAEMRESSELDDVSKNVP